jgi:hypothetical protein
MADRARPRRFIAGSPFNKPAVDESSLIVDFGSRVTRIRLPCPRMTKL